jgi:hypothetical protein
MEGAPRYCPHCYYPVYTGWHRCGNTECDMPVVDTLSAVDAIDGMRKQHARYRRALRRIAWIVGPVIGERLPQQGKANAREMRETLEAVYKLSKEAQQ